MRKWVYTVLILIVLAVNIVQPLALISSNSIRYSIHIGKTVPLQSVKEMAGGYRCYVNSDEYFWLSKGSVEVHTGSKLSVRFHIGQKDVIERKKQ